MRNIKLRKEVASGLGMDDEVSIEGFEGGFKGFGNVLFLKGVCEHSGSSLLFCFTMNI